MATQTSHYHWTLPATSDAVDISVLNNNFSGIDDTVYSLSNSINTLSDTIATVSTLIDRFVKSDVYTTDSTDLDNIKENSFRCVNSTAPHNPISKVCYLLTVRYNISRVTQLIFSTDEAFLWRGWNGSSWSAWTKKCSLNNLYTGDASDLTGGTTYIMRDSYTNYTYLLIVFKSNVEYTSLFIPTSLISIGKGVISTLFETSNPGTVRPVSEWSYCAYCRVSFPTTTTFINSGCFTNSNLTLKVHQIIGVNL